MMIMIMIVIVISVVTHTYLSTPSFSWQNSSRQRKSLVQAWRALRLAVLRPSFKPGA